MPLSEAMKAVLKASGFTDAQIAAMDSTSTPAKPTTTTARTPATKKASTIKYPSVYSTTQANAKINDFFQSTFGRDATPEEINKWRPLLIQAQKDNPSVQTYDPVTKTQSTVGGLDEAQWLSEQITKDPVYASELKTLATTPAKLAQRKKDKQIYDDAIAAAGNDQAKIAAANQGTNYGIAITGLKNRISLSADKAGAVVDEASIDQLAKEAYDTNQDVDPYTFQKFLDNKFKFGAEGFKGEAASNINELKKVALANGLDLQKAFGAQLPTWLESLNKGANIDDYKNIIRGVAKIGMPEKVSKLMDQGIDLETIYAPYQNMMENVLELPRGSITLDDPTLRAAITSEGEVPLYQFERNLRQDNRWQYTNSARDEVSSAVTKVLKDFGFQG